MDDVLNFIKEYYYLIIGILVLVILVLEVILSFRTKTKPSVLSFIDQIVPSLINDAEAKYGSGNGDDKFRYVLENAGNLVCHYFGIKSYTPYIKHIEKVVELVLSTPHKKED